MIASVVLAASSVGVLSMVNASYAASTAVRDEATAVALARELIEEVAAVPWTPAPAVAPRVACPGWPTVTNRQDYDNVADYDGYTDATTSLATVSGISVAAPLGGTFTRAVALLTTPLAGVTTPTNFMAVQVTVTTPRGRTITLSRLVAAGDTGRVGG